VQDITARKAMEAGLQLEARTDKLTGLANRQALMERLEAAVELARRDARVGFGLLFLDFDRFKLVNDTLGHEAGDELLRKIADRLRRSLRGAGGDTGSRSFVARIGGDEFVVLVSDTAELAEIERVSQRLLAALATPYMIRGSEVQSSASIGVVSSLQGELDASAVLRNADTAMYEAKRRGRGVAVLFDDGMHARLQREVVIERNLRRAIVMGEISLLYQPIIDLESGELSSMEALVRWRSAELGDVSPNEFIPIAEECGAIMELGEWVLYEACDQFAEWATNHPLSQATISVNLSRVQMGKPENLLATVERTLSATGLEAARLQLEVTERDVMRDPLAVIELMRKLRALGVRLAMDDFGTGTSSLACLRDYPFDVIKIDRAFVGDLTSNGQVLALVHATMMLIENLGMASVAEGVETAAQAAILQSVGCRYGQGWLFGVPARLGEVVERVGEA
jgi:diguanylate cyclase (GGDEF)-like protein